MIYKIISIKDLAQMLEVPNRTAEKYFNDMKKEYKPKSKKLTMFHFNDYFSIPKIKTT